jgi:hypothetical protein
MRPCINIKTTLLLLLLGCTINLSGQPGMKLYNELATNSMSGELIFKTAVLARFQIGNNKVETGFRADLKNDLKTGLSASLLKVSRLINTRRHQVEFTGYILNTPFSYFVSEKDFGIITNIRLKRLSVSTGIDFKSFEFNKAALRDQQGRNSKTRINESWNLLYSFEYSFISREKLNLTVALSDFDDFSVSQMINPAICLSTSYTVRNNVSFILVSGLKSAGMMNTNLNYFGTYIKTGLTWNF